jgi:hypothetical protein
MRSVEVRDAFLADLNALLVKWGATLQVEEDRRGFPKMVVDIEAIYDDDHGLTRSATEIILGGYCDGKP